MHRPWLTWASLLLTGLSVGVAASVWVMQGDHSLISPGTFTSTAPSEITLISYATPQSITTAQRSVSGGEFVVQTTFTDGRPALRCTAPQRLIGELAELTAKRGITLNERERDFPHLIGVLDIRTPMLSEPGSPLLFFSSRQYDALAVIDNGKAAEVTLPPSELARLERSCLR